MQRRAAGARVRARAVCTTVWAAPSRKTRWASFQAAPHTAERRSRHELARTTCMRASPCTNAGMRPCLCMNACACRCTCTHRRSSSPSRRSSVARSGGGARCTMNPRLLSLGCLRSCSPRASRYSLYRTRGPSVAGRQAGGRGHSRWDAGGRRAGAAREALARQQQQRRRAGSAAGRHAGGEGSAAAQGRHPAGAPSVTQKRPAHCPASPPRFHSSDPHTATPARPALTANQATVAHPRAARISLSSSCCKATHLKVCAARSHSHASSRHS